MQLTRRFYSMLATVTVSMLVLGNALAADVNGKWAWSMTPRGNAGGNAEPRKMVLTLKTEGQKLTGKLASPGRQGGQAREIDIEDGKVTGNEISFKVTREMQGNKFVTKYTGKVEGDVIKGKTEFERQGQTQSRDWEAKREK